jgi:hypothetical protein
VSRILLASFLFSPLVIWIAGPKVQAQASEKLLSPDKSYSVEIIRKPSPGANGDDATLVIAKGEKAIAQVPTSSSSDLPLEAYWSPNGKYVAVNKYGSIRRGGDYLWVFALPSGNAVNRAGDSLWDALQKKAWEAIDEKHLSETGGKVFLYLTASGWEGEKLHCVVEATFSEVEDRYRFEANVDPANPMEFTNWKMSKVKSSGHPE